jgi:hypothetical protein
MEKEPSLLVKGIRISSKIIGLITFIVFLSIGYTLYSEFTYFTQKTDIFQPSLVAEEGFKVKVPNKGLYPIEFQAKMEGYINDVRFLSADTGRVLINPNEEKIVKFEIKQEFERIIEEKEILQSLLVNGSEIKTSFLLFASLKPFVSIKIPVNQTQKVEPVFKGFQVKVKDVRDYNLTHATVLIEVSIDNNLPFLIAGNLVVELIKSPKLGDGRFGKGEVNIIINPLSRSINEIKLLVVKDAIGYGRHVIQLTFSMLDFEYSWEEVIELRG